MPIEVNIIIDLRDRPYYEERIIVPLHCKVRFITRLHSAFLERFQVRSGLAFAIYFENDIPSNFNQVNRIIIDEERFQQLYRTNITRKTEHLDVVIAEGTVTEKGEYKYGIKVDMNKQELFDEDPFLIVR